MMTIKAVLSATLSLLLGACSGPALTLKYEQHFAVRDEERLFYWVKHPIEEAPVICIEHTGMERLPKCSQPWEDLFDVEPSFDGPHNRFLQGESSITALDVYGGASLRPLCNGAAERFQLDRSERRAISAAASASGFFDLPEDLSKLPRVAHADGLDTIVIRDTCWTSELDVTFEGRHNHVRWTCDTTLNLGQEDDAAPQQLQPVLAAIEKAYATHSPVSVLLPYSRCQTMNEALTRRENAQR